jgi:hypothetical protein
MSDSAPKSDASTPNTTRSLTEHAQLRLWQASQSPAVKLSVLVLLGVTFFTGPAMAQTEIGDLYCGTAVETGINIVFGAIIALGLPAAMFFVGRSGLGYMRSTGDPQQQMEARKDLILSGVGFMIIVLAIISPQLISNLAEDLSFSFSECVKPWTFGD